MKAGYGFRSRVFEAMFMEADHVEWASEVAFLRQYYRGWPCVMGFRGRVFEAIFMEAGYGFRSRVFEAMFMEAGHV